jgi:hypothetical protein
MFNPLRIKVKINPTEVHKCLLIEETKEKYGYSLYDLSKSSHFPVLVKCSFCREVKETSHWAIAKIKRKNKNFSLDSFCCVECKPSKMKEICGNRTKEQYHLQTSRRESTLMERYGVVNPIKAPGVLSKRDETVKGRYGVENVFALLEIKDKIKAHNLRTYGVEFYTQSQEYLNKTRETSLAKRGVTHPSQDPAVKEKLRITFMGKYGTCWPNNTHGKTQGEIQTWLNQFGYNFQPNHRILEGREIDLYEDSLKLGIEYCGLYWHTEDSLTPRLKNYHSDKRLKCLANGVRLITIFEDEWSHRNDQCKNMLRSIVNRNSVSYFARKCEIHQLSIIDGRKFFDAHHIQGANHLGFIYLGAFYSGDLVAAMSLGRHPRKENIVTLDRFCVKSNHSVVGAASKMFKQLLTYTDAPQLLSWSDNRWSEGNVYEKLGFKLTRELPPDYSYIKFDGKLQRLSKQSQRKSATGCPENLTELQWANLRELHRIWDCGKKLWVYTR